MEKDCYNVIGVMSGTSLDGIDLAYVQFIKEGDWRFSILKAETVPYTNFWFSTLKNSINQTIEGLRLLDVEYTLFLSDVINGFIKKNKIDELDAVCSHGHTVFHQPQNGLTYQMGNLPLLAERLNQTVVCDFRVQDVKLGGQGAPLVPVGDELLFSQYDYCLNLGGFANISTNNGQRIAFDICPANIVLNHYVSTLGLTFDKDGELASEGKIHQSLLNELNALTFYSLPYPKSLGLEWVKKEAFPLIDSKSLSIKDVLRTFVEHIAIQILRVTESNKRMLVTGGGAYNKFLISRLGQLSALEIEIPSKNIVEFKEALVFALLGILRLRNETNCLKSVTGASTDHSSGLIFKP